MASLKSEKPVGTQLFGQVKKDPNKAADGATKAAPSKPGAKKSAPKVKEPKKKTNEQNVDGIVGKRWQGSSEALMWPSMLFIGTSSYGSICYLSEAAWRRHLNCPTNSRAFIEGD
ncbi:hypothetical protein JRO89_XS05G0015000 [Xanthoceras sorbifolium]|uniref:Uncharacterized protein n=1 Tax=Xanthoceras sorbifolium TaxID=99658 RepID=A0ABQ8HZW7_9ROSI|nr:hypothetical protein JRO89_XS05G0015000 [Xanthoceras sorbifolium]